MRSGTLAIHQMVGLGAAFAIAQDEMAADNARLHKLWHRLGNGVKDKKAV